MPTPTLYPNVLQPRACSDFTGASCLATLFPSRLCRHGTCCWGVSGPHLPGPARPPHTLLTRLASTEVEGQPVGELVLALDQPFRQLMVPRLPVGRSHGSALQPQSIAHTQPSLTLWLALTWHNQWVYGH